MSVANTEFLALQAAVAGRFSLEREIGRGGMGIVFLARDVQLERQVAIKLLAPLSGGSLDMRRRFLREARIAAQCFHPNIVPIHSVEESDTLAWIVMPYVRGETLADRVRRTGPLPPDEVRRLAQEIGWALSYAHQRGVVHRDIKPENILIEAASGRYLIADFGIARASDGDGSASPSGAGAGTPRYMAPEQALGETVDGRADLYALGATLFVAASGRPPFLADSSLALVVQHANEPAPTLRSIAPSIPVSLADAIDRCLAKRPDDRFANAEAFVHALTPSVGDEATPPSLVPLNRNIQNARTQLAWAAISGATTLLLVAGEPARSFGRDIISNIGFFFTTAVTISSGVHWGEALIGARRALQRGHSRRDVVKALAPQSSDVESPSRSRIGSAIATVLGVALALAEGKVSQLSGYESMRAIKEIAQIATLFAPPFLIARGTSGLFRGTRVSQWLHDRIAQPVARAMTRIAGRDITASETVSALPDNAATELRLDRAVKDAVAQLPPNVRDVVVDATQLAASLAATAIELRRQDARLVEEERVVRHMHDQQQRDTELARIANARDDIRTRLGTTIAALETLRLDVMRLDSANASQTGLTTQLDAVRELGLRVDANVEINAMLDPRSLSRSNP